MPAIVCAIYFCGNCGKFFDSKMKKGGKCLDLGEMQFF